MRRRRHIEEPSSHERWLVSYADFMTLLFALFVVLFASSYHDKQSLQKVSTAVQDGFKDLQVFSIVSTKDGSQKDTKDLTTSALSNINPLTDPANHNSTIELLELQRKLTQALGPEIEHKEVMLHMTSEGFVISLHELGFFNSGEAKLLPGASDKIKRIASVLMQNGLDMRVEGHSDNVPIHNGQFNSNWELSTGRANAVAMMLLDDAHFDPSHLSIAGYGQYHPVADNDTPEGRRTNRRVDIVVVSNTKPYVNKTN